MGPKLDSQSHGVHAIGIGETVSLHDTDHAVFSTDASEALSPPDRVGNCARMSAAQWDFACSDGKIPGKSPTVSSNRALSEDWALSSSHWSGDGGDTPCWTVGPCGKTTLLNTSPAVRRPKQGPVNERRRDAVPTDHRNSAGFRSRSSTTQTVYHIWPSPPQSPWQPPR